MSTFLQWFAMHGYGFYLWSAYGVVLCTLTLNIVRLKQQKVQTFKQLQRWFQGH